MSSKFFKDLYYPASETKATQISNMQPNTFRKILDYLFRGRVTLSSIEDAWKVKVAGRTFKLKELEDLCTKFLQYRIDSRNRIHFLKNTIKYDTPDIWDAGIARLLKDADKAFDNEQMLELSEEELMNIMSKRPQVKASKVMNVLIKWDKKKLALEVPKIDKKFDEEKKEDKKETSDDKSEIVEWDEKTEEEPAEQTQMLESFVKYSNKQNVHQQSAARPKEVKEQIRPPSPSRQSAPPKMGTKSA